MNVPRKGEPDPVPSARAVTEKPKMIFLETIPEGASPLSERMVQQIAALPLDEVCCSGCQALGRLWVRDDSDEGRDEAFSVIRADNLVGYRFACPKCSVTGWDDILQHPRIY